MLNGLEDPRNRRARVFELIQQSNSGDWACLPVWGEPAPSVESFSTCWCELDAAPSVEEIQFQGPGALFQMNAGDAFGAFAPVFGITSAFIVHADQTQSPARVWYSGNGWFGCSENLSGSDLLRINTLTSPDAELCIGHRGFVSGVDLSL